MATIYRDNTDTLTIAETKRLIIGAMPTELAAPMFASINEQGEIDADSLRIGEPGDACIHADFIDRDFLGLCQQQGIAPRQKYRPLFTDYPGTVDQDAYYTITHDEFVKLANLYGATVKAGTAPEQSAAIPAPVATASDGPAIQMGAPAWSLITSLQRAPGYRWPLYQALREAHTAGKPCPKAREVLEIWKQNTPPELEVMTDGVKYSDSRGNTKEADLKAIQQAIKGLLKK